MIALMTTLQRALAGQTRLSLTPREQQFCSRSLTYISTRTRQQPQQLEDWTITSYEVEFEEEIGRGGL